MISDGHCDVCGFSRRCVLLTGTVQVCEDCLSDSLAKLQVTEERYGNDGKARRDRLEMCRATNFYKGFIEAFRVEG